MSNNHGHFSLIIDNIANGGDGVGRLPDGRACFVPHTLPGEHIKVSLLKSKKKWALGVVEEIITPSSERISSECPYFQSCGGCQFWHTPYSVELHLKSVAILETIQRLSGEGSWPSPQIFASSQVSHYRNRATFHLRDNKIGFFRVGSKKLIEINQCHILDQRLNTLLEILRHNLFAYLQKKRYFIRDAEIFVETASPTEVAFIIKVKNARDLDFLQQWAQHNFERIKTTKTLAIRTIRIQQNINKYKEFGTASIDATESLRFAPSNAQLPLERFRQNNYLGNKTLVDLVLSWVASLAPHQILELFCGSGNFSLGLAQYAPVTALDVILPPKELLDTLPPLPHSIHWQETNLFHPNSLPSLDHTDLIVLDPPREGAKQAIQEIADSLSKLNKSSNISIIYIACDPSSLARDSIPLFAKGYHCTQLAFVDMFPRTSHIESIALFQR